MIQTPGGKFLLFQLILAGVTPFIQIFVGVNYLSLVVSSLVPLCCICTVAASISYRRKWFIKMIGFFNRKLKPIALIDFEGSEKYTLVCNNTGYVFWYTGVGAISLKEDGTFNEKPLYIKYWYPLNRDDKIVHFMVNTNLPDLDELNRLPSSYEKMLFLNKRQ